MTKIIIDTNVPITANGRSVDQASPQCIIRCVKLLDQFTKAPESMLVLDDGWEIIKEYKNRLNQSGQPGVGDFFLKWVLTNWSNPNKCELKEITPTLIDNKPTYTEFPNDDLLLADFDLSDRKFVAVAMTHEEHPPIWNAVDSDWRIYFDALSSHGIKVEFLCS
ncbi:MAG: hypothetical protein WA821_10340 [Anaerolineales bacterium]